MNQQTSLLDYIKTEYEDHYKWVKPKNETL